jgi:hypothetical protein
MARSNRPKDPPPDPIAAELAEADTDAAKQEEQFLAAQTSQAERERVAIAETLFRAAIDQVNWLNPAEDRHGRPDSDGLSRIIRQMRALFEVLGWETSGEEPGDDAFPRSPGERAALKMCRLVAEGKNRTAAEALRRLADRREAFAQAMSWVRGPMLDLVKGRREKAPLAVPDNQIPRPPNGQRPSWSDGVLSLGPIILKKYKNPARNQRLILSAFQEEKWCERIDDPLPAGCLRHTITDLNQTLANTPLRFEGDGTGLGVRWRLLSG